MHASNMESSILPIRRRLDRFCIPTAPPYGDHAPQWMVWPFGCVMQVERLMAIPSNLVVVLALALAHVPSGQVGAR
jgi:hypothetical protein